MAPTAGKRSSTAGKPTAKRSRTDNRIPTVVEAIADSDSLPADLRAILKVTLPIALNNNKADRHGYESEVVDQAQQALVAVEAALAQQHAAALAKQNEMIAPAETERRSAAKDAAAAHLEAVKTKLEANKASKKAGEKGVQEAKKAGDNGVQEAGNAVKAAQAEAKTADKELQRLVDKKSALADALATEFVLLKEGASAGPVAKKAVQKVLALVKGFVSNTMMQTFPLVCKKPTGSRSEFEASVFNSLQGLMEREIATRTEAVGQFEPTKVAKDAALSDAQMAKDAAIAEGKRILEAAEATLKAADEELNATQTSHKDAAKELGKADASLRAIWGDMQEVCDAQDDLANTLKDFKENIWASFNALKEKEPEPEPVVEEAPADEHPVPETETAPAMDAAAAPVAEA